MTATLSPRDASRVFQRYSKQYAAGAFATPTAKEMEEAMARGDWIESDGFRGVARTLTRESVRRDFTGRPFVLPGGARVLTHVALEPGATVPPLDAFDFVFAYCEDRELTSALAAQGRGRYAVKVSAASELIGCWGGAGDAWAYDPVDRRTMARLPFSVSPDLRGEALEEVEAVTSWHDDFPYYSDGSWDAVSLRGFNPADPRWGVKPSEMGKSWHAEHPGAHAFDRCDWTVLAGDCPALVNIVQSATPWAAELERVRLLRMTGRSDKPGRLGRHSDITDRAAGTRDGQVVRFHIPLITHPAVSMTVWNLDGEEVSAHLDPWSLWYLDARKPHSVTNASGQDRVHLVIDAIVDDRVRAAIVSGEDAA